MKKFFLVAVVMSIVMFSSNAFAIKFGVFLDFSSGSGEAEWETDFYSFDVDAKTIAGGLILDTATDKTFNYRLNVGLAKQKIEDEYGIELTSTGIYLENIFGFALVKNKDFRWWLGPLVRIGYYSGKSDTISSGTMTARIDIDYVEFGVGAVTGLNFKTGSTIISPSAGFRVSGFAGEGKTVTNFSSFNDKEDIVGHTTTAFANIAVLF
jgi:hypothetical protein